MSQKIHHWCNLGSLVVSGVLGVSASKTLSEATQPGLIRPHFAIRGFHCSISTWSNGPLLIQALCIVNVQQILSSTSRPFPSAWVLVNFLKTFKVILHSHWSWYLAHFFVFTSSMCSFQSTVYSSTINFWYSDHVRQQPWWFCLGWKL